MFHALTIELRKVYQRWLSQPLWALGLCFLVGSLIGSGPLACLVHCVAAGETHHAQHIHHAQAEQAAVVSSAHGGLIVVNEHGDHALCDALMGQLAEHVPSALTLGVVGTLSLIPHVLAVALRRLDLELSLRFFSLPPPRNPPRMPNSFAL